MKYSALVGTTENIWSLTDICTKILKRSIVIVRPAEYVSHAEPGKLFAVAIWIMPIPLGL